MSVTEKAKSALNDFEKENPKLVGKAYLTSGDRSISEQIEIILDPKRKDNYVHIKERFKSKYKLEKLPDYGALTEEQSQWWEENVKLQAGKSPGFPHVGGHAQDVSVKNLTKDDKIKLKKKFEQNKLKILMEKVTGSTSEYGVSVDAATVFHVTVE